jgi:Ca2+-transporting ATPase
MSRKLYSNIIGLTDEEVKASRKSLVRTNKFTNKHKWWFLLIYSKNRCYLIAVAVIYFVMGQNNEAYFMLAAIVVVSEFLLPGQPQSDCDGIFRKKMSL